MREAMPSASTFTTTFSVLLVPDALDDGVEFVDHVELHVVE